MIRRSTKTKLKVGGILILLWVAISTAGQNFMVFDYFHNRLTDWLHDPAVPTQTDVTLVAIDPKSLLPQSQGGLGRWQDWQRAYYAKAIENLRGAGAKVIGLDIFFSEPTAEPRKNLLNALVQQIPNADEKTKQAAQALAASDDATLQKAIKDKTDVILAANVGGNESLLPTIAVTGSGAKLASVTLIEDRDNILRKVPLYTNNAIVPLSFSFALFMAWSETTEDDFVQKAAEVRYTGPVLRNGSGNLLPQWHWPVDAEGRIYPRFRGAPLQRFPRISFVDAYNNKFDPALVRGKVVLIGEVDSGLHDDLYTPMSMGVKRPGVEVHAQTLQSMIYNDTIQEATWWQHALATTLAVALLVVIGILFGPVWGLIALLALLAGTVYGSIWSFENLRIIISIWYMGIALIGAYATVLIYKLFLEQFEKKQAIKAFSHYVSDKVAQMIVRDPSLLKLGGEKKELTVTFTDIAGFTTLSEELTPEQITDFLHIYLDTMTQIILKEDGTLDKYIGDAIMSIYGAPIAFQDHAIRACRASLAMHAAIPDILRQLPLSLPEQLPLAIRTGIATGEMVVGNFGSHKRFDYTVIGDTVNLSSRLEGANKQYSSQICVNETTFEAAKDVFLFRTLDIILVKGKHKPVRIYELMAPKDHLNRETEAMVEDFERAFLLYQQKDFATARERFKDIHQTFADAVAEVYMHRCAHFAEQPPEANWDGVFTMTSK